MATSERATDALALVLVKMAIGAWVLHQGFSHISDDDYARTVIAEGFAHAPRLDPSGTSWLPLPFWLEGTVMAVAGRTLGVARAVAGVLGAASVAAPYVAMRAVGMRRAVALAATSIAMALPYNAWLGVATVPEGWSGALVAAAVITMGLRQARAWAVAGLLVGALSRYEAWPACALMAALCAWSAACDGAHRWDIGWALVAVAGPVGWMAWNAHVHGDALHFLTRVATFRHAIGAAPISVLDKLMGYPRALATDTPEAAAFGVLGVVGLASRPALRRRWAPGATAVLTTLAMLVWGDVNDGAPTHHAARALAITWWVLVAMGVDAAVALMGRLSVHWRGACAAAASLVGLVWCATLPVRWAHSPGRTPSERRERQIARGLELRASDVAHADITPCAFEHFALLAAWGAPERATIAAPTHGSAGSACPRVEMP